MRIEELKVGDGLICDDFGGLVNNKYYLPKMGNLDENPYVVIQAVRVEAGIIAVTDSRNINIEIFTEQLKYFKKKGRYTFDDLIDVAVQAFKDRAIFSVGITICAVSIRMHDKSEEVFTMMEIGEGIDFIQSLYKETFVIEREEDIKRIKAGAKITLNNGNLLTVKNTYFIVEDHISIDAYTDECTTCQNLNRNIGIVFLKGATVEQGRND